MRESQNLLAKVTSRTARLGALSERQFEYPADERNLDWYKMRPMDGHRPAGVLHFAQMHALNYCIAFVWSSDCETDMVSA